MSWSTQRALKTALTDRPQIMWITSTFYACYIERYDVEQFAALLCKTFWSDQILTQLTQSFCKAFQDDCTKRDDDYDLNDECDDYDEYNDTNDDKDTPASCGDCVCTLSDAATGTRLERKKMKMMKNSMMAKLRRSRMDEVSVFPLNQLESALNQLESATPNCSLAVKPQSTTEQI